MCLLDVFYLGISGSDPTERGGRLAVVFSRILSIVKATGPNVATYLKWHLILTDV